MSTAAVSVDEGATNRNHQVLEMLHRGAFVIVRAEKQCSSLKTQSDIDRQPFRAFHPLRAAALRFSRKPIRARCVTVESLRLFVLVDPANLLAASRLNVNKLCPKTGAPFKVDLFQLLSP